MPCALFVSCAGKKPLPLRNEGLYDPKKEECSCKKISPEEMEHLTLIGNSILGRIIMELMECEQQGEASQPPPTEEAPQNFVQ